MDVTLANSVARLEVFNRNLYRPNAYLHKWWGRRCGSTFRAILKSIAENPMSRDYYAPGGLEGKVVLDPMMGGGTTLHEAIRLGANVIGVDLDPIPVLQARATLADTPDRMVGGAFDALLSDLRGALSPLFRTPCPACDSDAEVQFVLHAARRVCACGLRLFVDSTVLRYAPSGEQVRLCAGCLAVVRGRERCGCAAGARQVLLEKGVRRCSDCGETYAEERRLPYFRRYVPVAVAGRCVRHGRFFARPGPQDSDAIERADLERQSTGLDPREFAVRPGPKSRDLLRRGVTSYLDLFSSRQVIFLGRAVAALGGLPAEARLPLGLLVSTALDFNSLLCGYKGRYRHLAGVVRHTFSHHGYSFPYTALENNPVCSAPVSGTLRGLYESRIRRAREWARRPTERVVTAEGVRKIEVRGEVDLGVEVRSADELRGGSRRFLLIQGSAASLPLPSGSVDFVVTDPPYLDSVQYGDLARFFHVWLQRMLPADARWEYDADAAAIDVPGGDGVRYARVMSQVFSECRRVLRGERGRLIFTFHHWGASAWAALAEALTDAGFVLAERHVVVSESPASVHIVGAKALTHDAVLVLAPEGWGQQRVWARPSGIDRSDSEAFCRSCADALGWVLLTAPSAAEAREEWDALWDRGAAGRRG